MKSYILITGATGGLGSAFCQAAAKKGYDLILTDLPENGRVFADELQRHYGVETLYYPCDLTSDSARDALAEQLSAYKFWGLINVAGLDYEGEYSQLNHSHAMRIIKVNLLANMDLTHRVLQNRDPERTFRMINVCSMAGFYPMPFKATYAATKRFLLDFSLALREELKGEGTVTALCPGGMPTTEECMRAIFAQGFWGWATTVDTHKVAEATLTRALRGQAIYIPGWANKMLQAISILIPTTMKVSFVAARWRKAQAQWQEQRPAPSVQHGISSTSH